MIFLLGDSAPMIYCSAMKSLLVASLLFALGGERYIAVDNVCAWPNLKVLPDGTIAAVLFNQPSHGRQPGHVEVWSSKDGGKMWSLTGVPAPHDPNATRLNHAFGLAHDGAMVVLVSGEHIRTGRDIWLPALACRSTDGGKTWTRSDQIRLPEGVDYLIPFGDIVQLPGNTLAASFYQDRTYTAVATGPRPAPKVRTGTAYVLFSKDDGLTWGDAALLGKDDYNETTLLRLGPDRLLAAARTYRDGHLDLMVSSDEGRTWKNNGPVTLPSHHPASLLRLRDGRILLTYGVREKGNLAVHVRLSEDAGQTWKAPRPVVQLGAARDGGYPSTVELADGTLVTAYYASGVPEHQRYHMGVVRWSLKE